MKITIKKFMELSNISFETPVKIEAGHDVGKSTIFRAVLFAITGKDIDGKEFDGRIYPKKAESLSELIVEVEIEQSGVVFNKKATGEEEREKGKEKTALKRSVTAKYSINYQVVTKREYDAKIQEVFGNFHLFCNPDYFRKLQTTNKEEARKIFTSIVSIDKNKYFDGLQTKATVKAKKTEQEKEIVKTETAIEELLLVKEPEKIEVVDYSGKLAELRKQRQEAEPKFTFDQLKENGKIRGEILSLEFSTFIPEPLIPLLPEIEKPALIDVEGLKKELERVQLSEPDMVFIDAQICDLKIKRSEIISLKTDIENYDENVKEAKCTLCHVCAAPDCQFKRVELMSLDELRDELSKRMPLLEAEKSLETLESQKIDYLRDFAIKKESEISRLEKEIINGASDNNNYLFNYETKRIERFNENLSIKLKNSETTIKNSETLANFETDKAQKIAELKGQLHTLPAFDYSEIDEKIDEIILEKASQQLTVDAYNKLLGSFEYAKERIKTLSDDLQKMKESLYSSERELIKIEKAENDYYNDFENLINNEMPENIKVSLFKKNLSNDDRSEVFEIEFNGSIYAGNGKTIAFYIWLCSWFQSKFGKDLPIFIDEAIILNESLYSNVKNTVILMRNDNCKTLKISEL